MRSSLFYELDHLLAMMSLDNIHRVYAPSLNLGMYFMRAYLLFSFTFLFVTVGCHDTNALFPICFCLFRYHC